MLARKEPRADYCFEKALLLAPKDWFTLWLAARIRFYYKQFVLALKLLQQAVEWNTGHFLPVAGTWPVPAGAGLDQPGRGFFHAGVSTEPAMPGRQPRVPPAFPCGILAAHARLVPATFQTMSTPNLDRLLSCVNDFDASDLHLIAGVPPAFRVNGEIIIADEDALTVEDITKMADSLLNDLQKKKFEQEWELCIHCCTALLDGCG